MNKTMQERAEKLAEAHWQYVKEALETVMPHDTEEDKKINEEVLDIIGFHYKTAFIHGYKHGVEDVNSIFVMRDGELERV